MYLSPQSYSFATPPALGDGVGYSLRKSPKFNLLAISKYNLEVTSKDQYSNQNDLSYSVDVFNADGTIAPNGANFDTGVRDPFYTFSYDDNISAFNGSPKREYSLVFKLSETSPPTTSSGRFRVHHNEASLSGISNIYDGTLQIDGSRSRTGSIDVNVNMANKSFYSLSKFEIYTGDSSNFSVVTGTGAGANLLKSIPVFDQRVSYTLTIKEGEQPSNDSYYFYKILPYDDFGSGVLHSTPPSSGLMYSLSTPAFVVNNLTGKSVILLNSGAYSIQTFHSGSISNVYGVIDRVSNVAGNIISGGWYNASAVGDFDQNITYPFKTIKYLAQTIDATGNVSSREILITDNTTSRTGDSQTGIIFSEYAISDNNKSAQFLVSGEGYDNGTGHICLLARVNYPTGTYKLLRTLL